MVTLYLKRYLPETTHLYSGQHVPGFPVPGRTTFAHSPGAHSPTGQGPGRHWQPCGTEQHSSADLWLGNL